MMAAMSSADGLFGPGLRRGEADDEAIDGREIGRPLPGAITDEQLVLEQQGLGGDGADATGAKELRKGDQQVDGKDGDFTHRANLPSLPVRARLHGACGLRHNGNSPLTGIDAITLALALGYYLVRRSHREEGNLYPESKG